MISRLLIAMLVLGVAGCTSSPQSFCSVVQEPILIDKKDVLTTATTRRIVGVNEAGLRLCNWKRP